MDKKKNPEFSIDKIERLGRQRHYKKNELLFYAQDKATGMYYVRSGGIRVYKMDDQGKEVEVARLRPGDFLGEAILFVSPVFPFYAQAVKDTEVLFFAKDAFFNSLKKDIQVAGFFLHLLASKCLTLNERIETLGLLTVRQRIAQYLLSKCSGERACLVELKIKKAELAKLMGTVSETLSRNLRQMQEEGIIEVRGRRIRVKNCPALREELSC